MSRKVFTAGEVLAAADVNSFLMDQTVMSFAGTAARGSAIGTATEGMYTHLEDSDKLEFWDGSAWRTPFGLTLLADTDFSAAATVNANNLFTSEFTSYYATMEMTSASTGGTVTLRYSDNTSPITASNYNHVLVLGTFSATSEVSAVSGATSQTVGVVTTTSNVFDFDIMNISATAATTTPGVLCRKVGAGGTGGFTVVSGGGIYTAAVKVTGFGISISGGNMTGSLKVYGKRG
jgi:hypothetical protein